MSDDHSHLDLVPQRAHSRMRDVEVALRQRTACVVAPFESQFRSVRRPRLDDELDGLRWPDPPRVDGRGDANRSGGEERAGGCADGGEDESRASRSEIAPYVAHGG